MANDYDKAKPRQVVVHFHQNLSGRPPRVAQKKARAGDLHLHRRDVEIKLNHYPPVARRSAEARLTGRSGRWQYTQRADVIAEASEVVQRLKNSWRMNESQNSARNS